MRIMKPEELHPGLTRERLMLVAGLIREARHSAVQSYQPENGDLPWSLGCVAYVRSIYAIARAAEEREDWLKVIESGLHFVFAVGGVPLRFYRGEPESPPGTSLRCRYPEIEALQLAFGFVRRKIDGVLRLAVTIDEQGEASSVTLVQVDEAGEPIDSWRIPFAEGEVRRLYEPKKPVDVGPPSVGVRKDVASKED
jgi:hypothetical protein